MLGGSSDDGSVRGGNKTSSTDPEDKRPRNQLVHLWRHLSPHAKVFVGLVWLLVVLLCLVFVDKSGAFRMRARVGHRVSLLDSADPTITKYCNVGPIAGVEGTPDGMSVGAPASDLTLMAVALAIRHGDRSGIHVVSPQPTSLQKEMGGQFVSCAGGNLEPLWSDLPHRFRVVSAATGAPLQRTLRPLLVGSGTACAAGQLTSRGFKQHMRLGEHLRTAYGELLSQDFDFYVRSTDYPRTVGSAAALLGELLKNTAKDPSGAATPAVDIAVHEDLSKEVMLGAVSKNSAKVANGGAADDTQSMCPPIVQGAREQRKTWHNPPADHAELRRLLGPGVDGLDLTDFADASYVAFCHALPMPSGPGGSIEGPLAASLSRSADAYYCARYAGAAGGLTATQLSMYPFLKEVLGRLQQAASADASPSLSVFSGHDTVIAPVLAAIGVYEGERCGWPPYASRIAFELYRRAPQAQAAAAAASSSSSGARHFVRVVYNGKTMRGVRGCDKGVELCPLANFTAGVHSLLGGAPNLATACRSE